MTETDVLTAITERIEKSFTRMEDVNIKQAESITEIKTVIKGHIENSDLRAKEVKRNTIFRLHMEGMAWARYGIPVVLFLITIGTLVASYIKG